MSFKTVNIIDKAINPKKDKYNILTFDTHERYQTQLCKTGHNFYSFRYDKCKEWDTKYAPIPDNYYILPKGMIVHGLYFDFILSQSKFGQFQASKQINQNLNLPIISLEHTLPLPQWSDQQLQYFKSMVGDFNIFISAYSISQWKMDCASSIVHHSVDTELFSPREKSQEDCGHDYVLSVVNDFKNRDHCCNYSGWERVTAGLKVKLVGDNPGLSLPAPSPEALADEYRSARVFLNTSTISPVPTSLLEAMACGCAVVSTATCMIPEIIRNGINGFCSNDEEELREYIELLLTDENLAKRVGANARTTILEKFSETEFINKWNTIFDAAYGVKK